MTAAAPGMAASNTGKVAAGTGLGEGVGEGGGGSVTVCT